MGPAFPNKRKTLFGYVLSPQENAVLNHLFPSVLASFLFMLIIATDVAVIFRHYKDEDPIWASLTLFFMYLPAMGSFIIIITDGDYWPEPDNGMTSDNLFWLYKKVIGHLFFPIWSMWRFAERIFWSIEASLNTNEEEIDTNLERATESRLIELYVFLQSYLHSLPQALLQLHILMRHKSDIPKVSKNVQAFCIILNLAKLAVTTVHYQRFKAQKLTGSEYPWLKKKKIERSRYSQDGVLLRKSNARRIIEKESSNLDDISRLYDIEPAVAKERRRSSDIYLEPEPSTSHISHQEEIVPTRNSYVARFSSMLGFRDISMTDSAKVNYDIPRLNYINGLMEDDVAGKTIAFLWWFTFLISRVLAISVFAYFFLKACVWLLISHVIFVILVLMYDVKTENIKRDKMVFFVFLGLVYIFCIIEFKVRFKKANLIYFGYFGLVFMENILMCLVWYFFEIESLENDYWYRYLFYVIVVAELFSLSSMVFYFLLSKPKTVPIRISE